MKWGIVSEEDPSAHSQVLSDYLKELGLENSFEWVKLGGADLKAELPKIKERFDQLRVGSPYGEKIVTVFTKTEASVRDIGAADCVVKVDGQWWPRAALFYACSDLLKVYGEQMDPRSAILMIGAGAAARMSLSALVRIGFQRVLIANQDEVGAEALAVKLRRQLMGIQFDVCPMEKLILLPGSHGLAVNTTPFSGDNEILSELYYFNFLKPGGMIWDMTLAPVETPLLQEAKDIGIKAIKGYQILARVDEHWLKWVAPQLAFDRDTYESRLVEKLGATKA